MANDPNTQHDYDHFGRTSDGAKRLGENDAHNGRGMTGQQHNESTDLYRQREEAHRRETERQAEERKRNGY